MNDKLERRLGEHIEEGARFQGKMLQWVENFDEKVLPGLVTEPLCLARHKALRLDLATGELDERKASNLRWRNRLWGALMAALLLFAGAWFNNDRGDANAAADEARDVPRSGVAVPRDVLHVGRR